VEQILPLSLISWWLPADPYTEQIDIVNSQTRTWPMRMKAVATFVEYDKHKTRNNENRYRLAHSHHFWVSNSPKMVADRSAGHAQIRERSPEISGPVTIPLLGGWPKWAAPK
jgi:hypothetical protein